MSHTNSGQERGHAPAKPKTLDSFDPLRDAETLVDVEEQPVDTGPSPKTPQATVRETAEDDQRFDAGWGRNAGGSQPRYRIGPAH